MDAHSTFAERLIELQGDRSARSFASFLGLSEGTYRALIKGGSPTLDTLLAIAEGAGVSIAWLAAGEGAKTLGPSQSQSQSQSVVPVDGLALIPRLDVAASAGFGSLADIEHHVGLIAFQADWLRRRGITPEAARALTARGDSMEPTIRSGDLLLVDTAIDHVKDNGIYVVVLSGMILVKRIHVRMDGSLRLISDNKDLYEPEDIRPDRVQDLAVAGRVMWYGRSI